ncbi:MAG: hypothetical protein HY471_00800 [Candidatus Sungbacteria bacterium]|nr:hypothetical protein [Candidatus Sungbacteria bacterium]
MPRTNLLGAEAENDTKTGGAPREEYLSPQEREETDRTATRLQEQASRGNLYRDRAQNPGEPAESPRAAEGEDKAEREEGSAKPTSAFWLILCVIAAGATTLSWLADFFAITAPLGFAISYSTTGVFWLVARLKDLTPPNFGSNLKVLSGVKLQKNAAEVVPGSDFMYVFLSGATPFVYLFGLWLNNR